MLSLMPANPGDFTVEEIIADLRVLRERGLVRLRHTDLGDLSRAASRTNVAAAAAGGPGAVEALLRAAVENLGGGELGAAATATFGLGRGARDWPGQDRRRKAAMVYGVSVERFRKHHERIVIEQIAEEILKLVMAPADTRRPPGFVRQDFDRQIVLEAEIAGIRVPLVVHVEPVELLSGVDIIVVPQNTYLELPQHFKSSVSAAVRRAAAIRSADGQIVTDVVADELRAWVNEHGRPGLPVQPGTVVATSPGELASQGIRRLYHVAVAAPRPGTNDYDVEPIAIASGVRNVLARARSERHLFDPWLRSVGFPLLGAGRGGLDPATSFTWLWASLERDIREHGSWEIHFITHRRPLADLIVAKIAETGVISTQPSRHAASSGEAKEAALDGAPDPADLSVVDRLLAAPALTAQQVRERGCDPERTDLIRLPGSDGAQLPAFQFGPDGQPIPVVAAINRLLRVAEDPWGVADWWLGGNAWLNAVPAHLLGQENDELLTRAALAELPEGNSARTELPQG